MKKLNKIASCCAGMALAVSGCVKISMQTAENLENAKANKIARTATQNASAMQSASRSEKVARWSVSARKNGILVAGANGFGVPLTHCSICNISNVELYRISHKLMSCGKCLSPSIHSYKVTLAP
jgi:hypothetical protein